MYYEATIDRKAANTKVVVNDNCHTDSSPLVSTIFFDNAEFETKSDFFVLACAILTRRYCGEHFEFAHHKIGSDFVDAIRTVLPRLSTITPVDASLKALSSGEADIACFPAGQRESVWRVSDNVPLIQLDWSGDCVSPHTRSSEGYCLGRYFTNAGVVTDETAVSIALGLMHAGARCRNLFVPIAPGVSAGRYESIQRALAIVAITLRLVATHSAAPCAGDIDVAPVAQ